MLQMLRQAIDESGWKHEALAVELGLTNAAYLSRMLAGEKPWTLRHLAALPDDVEAIFFRLRSESLGQIVVQPVDFETARRHLVSGLVGVLSHRGLPEKAGQPLKAGLKEK